MISSESGGMEILSEKKRWIKEKCVGAVALNILMHIWYALELFNATAPFSG